MAVWGPGWLHWSHRVVTLQVHYAIAMAAFALVGPAWYHRLTGNTQLLNVADEVLAFAGGSLASG